jgi:hypothetical protein
MGEVKALQELLPTTDPLWDRLLHRTDFIAPTTRDGLEWHLWHTWLRWLPTATEEPLYLQGGSSDAPYGWSLCQHPHLAGALLHCHNEAWLDPYSSFVREEQTTVDIPPIDYLTFDSLPADFVVVGFSAAWKTLRCALGEDVHEDDPVFNPFQFAHPTNWAQLILHMMEHCELGLIANYWKFSATPWRLQNHSCVLFSGW